MKQVLGLLAIAFAMVSFAGDWSPVPRLRSPLELIGAIEPWNSEEKDPYIVNGQATNYQIYKSAVAIMSGGSLCTASLIDPEVLLTAGHCVYLKENGQLVMDAVSDPSSITVRNGANVYWGGTTIAYGQEVVKHSTWTGDINTWNAVDLALIHLDRKVTSIDSFPVRVAPNEAEGSTGVIVGYGITSTDASDSGVHRYGNTTILNIGNILGKQLIEVGNPAGACQGDSGGPFLTQQFGKDVVSGVASFVTGQCSATSGSYYTWVLPYRDWIESIVVQFTGHGFVNEEVCGDANDVCSPGETKDCHLIDEHYASETSAACNDGCYWWDTSVCTPNCGDGYVLSPEVCDSDVEDCQALGQYLPGTNAPCKSDCSGYDTSVCTATVCGDGNKEGNEFCDTQITSCATLGSYPENYYARCNDTCDGYLLSDCENAVIVCGDGSIDPFEECDDGNTASGDGCSSKCKNEAKPDNDTVQPDTVEPDSDTALPDVSDETQTDTTAPDEATSDSTVPDETASDEETPDVAVPDEPMAVCGNGILEEGEQCDDGNLIPGDECNPDCHLPGSVSENCGNGVVDSGEECDDGNFIPGDGCNPDCTIPTTDKPLPRASSDGCSCALIL